MIVRDLQLAGRAKHAVARLPSDHTPLDIHAVRKVRARQRKRNAIADGVVARAADDVALGRTVVRAHEHEVVGVRMLAHRANLADDDAADAGADADHLVDLETEHRQVGRHRLGVVVDRREFAKPGKRNPHQTWNPARKR